MGRTEDLALLGLDPGGAHDRAAVKAAYRAAARAAHPDAGGAVERFQALNSAYKRQLARLGGARCGTCNGKGTIQRRRGFAAVSVVCPTCHGKRS